MLRKLGFLVLSFACADPMIAPPPPDGGTETDAATPVFEPSPIAAPEPPRLDALAVPVMTPCPSGWREVPPAENGLPAATCEPFPGGSADICPEDEALFPGTEGCARIGTECPVDRWPVDLPTDRTVLYVDANATGGNGTRSSPFGSIADAIAVTGDGAVIALAKGTYDEAVVIDKAVTLWGACVRETLIDESAFAGTITVEGSGALIKNLRIAGSDLGIRAAADAVLRLEDVVISGASGAGVLVDGGLVTGNRVVIRSTQDGSHFGRGLVALAGARVSMTHAELFSNADSAIFAAGMSTDVAIELVTIRDTRGSDADGTYGIGAYATEGAHISLDKAALERNRDRAIWAYDNGSIRATDAVIRNTRASSADDTDGYAAASQIGSSVVLERTWIDGARAIGIFVGEQGASASLTDVIVHRVQPQLADGLGGRGINAQIGTTLAMERVVVKETNEMGVFAAADTHATLSDVIIEDVHSIGPVGAGFTLNFAATGEIERMRIARVAQVGIALGGASSLTMRDVAIEDGLGLDSDGSEGSGVVVQEGSKLSATRLSVERCRDQGVFARDENSEMIIEDLIVREIEADAVSGKFGRGIGVEVSSKATVKRAILEATTENAIMAHGYGAAIRIEDVVVSNTRARPLDGTSGRGLGVQLEAHADVTRARFSDGVEVGVFVSGAAATATLTDVVIERTESRADGVGGRGLDVNQGARVTARGILLADNREFGVVVVNDGSRVEMIDAIITNTRENACPAEECLGFGKGGTGAASAKNAALSIRRFSIERSALAGLALTRGGTIDLFDGEVAFNPVGVNVDAPDYDLDRLRNQVRYHDNDLTLQSISVPEPRSSDLIEGAID